MMVPYTSMVLKHMAFIAMLAISIWIFFVGLTIKSDSPAFRDIRGVPLTMIQNISIGVWLFGGIVYTGITLHYARSRPFWALVTFMVILLMTAFFTAYLGFDPLDWSTWGPFAAVLGIVVKIGIHHTYNSADRGLLRRSLDYLMGNIEEDDREYDNNDGDRTSNRRHGQELDDFSRRRFAGTLA